MNNHPSRSIFHLFTLLTLLLSMLGSAVLVTPAHAVPSTWTVQSPDDDGTAVPGNCPGASCRLRDAIEAAAPGGTIDFSSNFTITLVSQIYFEKSLTITAGGRNVAISGGGTTRIFEISGDGNTILFNHLTLMNGNGVDRGAAIYLHYRYGYNNLTIVDSSIHDNHSSDSGGAINVSYDTLQVYNSTFYNNTSDIAAGAIESGYGNTIIENSTFYNNHTPAYAGALSQAGGSIVLTNNTFVGNGAPQGANVDFITGWGTVVTLNNNIFANGTSGASCACDNGWAACSLGGSNNFATDGSCGTGTTVMSPSLAVFGSLGNYGGSTQTIPLLPGNPAINGGGAAMCAGLQYGDYDQRNVTRFGDCDAGSFESQGFTLTKVGGDNQFTVTGSPFGLPLTASIAALNAVEPVTGGKVTFTSPATGAGTNPVTNTATIASGGSVSQNLTANSVPGPYTVAASANGESISYSLRNTSLPVITWSNPANIVYGTPLGATQLNATADVLGVFAYTPASGTVLNAGTHTLHVYFIPTDTTNYTDASQNVSITVTKAAPVITWADPAGIDQGTALSATQLNATADVPGTFTYTPAGGIYLSTGTHTLHVDFVPTDAVNYAGASKEVNITINDHVLFADVTDSHWARSFIERLYLNQVTGGCGSSPLIYCPAKNVTRAQMAIFVLRAAHGATFAPPAATGTVFTDVPADSFAAAWIEQLVAEGITGGCGGNNFCPNASITRAQMAVFLVKAMYGAAYTPPDAVGGVFADVPADGFAAAFIEQLVADGITGGCGGGDYCPNAYVTRAEMAVFLVTAFNLP
jgi:hypothetical protein